MRLGNDAAWVTSWLAAPVLPRVPAVAVGDVVYAGVGVALFAVAGLGALGLDAGWSAPLLAQHAGERPLLLGRAAALALAIVRVRPLDGARARALVVVGALLVLSLVARGAWVPAWCAMGLVVHRFGDRSERAAAPWSALAALALPVLAFLALHRPPPPAAAPIAGPPAAQIEAWRARGNPYRAHAVALAWATGEGTPGEGHLALAELDHAMGDDGKASKVLAKVLASPASDSVRERAAAHEREWPVP